MLLGIDHLVVAVHDPDAAVEELATLLHIEPAGGGRHPALGTRNRIVWLGDSFVELLGIADESVAASSWLGAPAVEALVDGPALVGWAIASDDLGADIALLRKRGMELSDPVPGERRRPDGRVVRWRNAQPARLGLDRPFLIEHDVSAAEWAPADRARRAALPGRLATLDLPVDAIAGLAGRDGAIQLGAQLVRLTGRASGDPTIMISGLPGLGAAALLGCRWAGA